MSEVHEAYKKLCILKGKYNKVKYNNYSDDIVFKYKYDYLKQELEHLILRKEEDFTNDLRIQCDNGWEVIGRLDEVREKMKNDNDIIKLNRVVQIMKIQLLNVGYNKVYL